MADALQAHAADALRARSALGRFVNNADQACLIRSGLLPETPDQDSPGCRTESILPFDLAMPKRMQWNRVAAVRTRRVAASGSERSCDHSASFAQHLHHRMKNDTVLPACPMRLREMSGAEAFISRLDLRHPPGFAGKLTRLLLLFALAGRGRGDVRNCRARIPY